jgi:hypothetical protein
LKHGAWAAVAVVVAAAPAWAQGAWKTMSDAEYGFTAEFPVQPEVQSVPLDTPAGPVPQVVLKGRNETGVYFVIVADVRTPGEHRDPRAMIDTTVQGMLDELQDEKVLSSTDITVSGAPARDMVVSMMDGAVTMRVRIAVAHDRIYQIAAVQRSGDTNEDYKRFLASLRISEPRAAK